MKKYRIDVFTSEKNFNTNEFDENGEILDKEGKVSDFNFSKEYNSEKLFRCYWTILTCLGKSHGKVGIVRAYIDGKLVAEHYAHDICGIQPLFLTEDEQKAEFENEYKHQ